MTGVPLAPTMLPKAGALTDLLVAPVGDGPDQDDLVAIAGRVRRAATRLTPGDGGRRLTVDRWFIRSAAVEPSLLGAAHPFSWSARSARRAVGLPAARLCVVGRHAAPADAVAAVMADLGGAPARAKDGSLAHWLSATPAGGRAVVRAEAVRWATELLGALEWERLDAAAVGAADPCWVAPGGRLAVRGRTEVRVRVARTVGGPGRTAPEPWALLTVVGGLPGPTSRAELGLSALAAALAGAAPPARVVGWWPACGRAAALTVDPAVLDHTARAVIAGLERATTERRPGGGAAGRAITGSHGTSDGSGDDTSDDTSDGSGDDTSDGRGDGRSDRAGGRAA